MEHSFIYIVTLRVTNQWHISAFVRQVLNGRSWERSLYYGKHVHRIVSIDSVSGLSLDRNSAIRFMDF